MKGNGKTEKKGEGIEAKLGCGFLSLLFFFSLNQKDPHKDTFISCSELLSFSSEDKDLNLAGLIETRLLLAAGEISGSVKPQGCVQSLR